jgi:hypothetical protein
MLPLWLVSAENVYCTRFDNDVYQLSYEDPSSLISCKFLYLLVLYILLTVGISYLPIHCACFAPLCYLIFTITA